MPLHTIPFPKHGSLLVRGRRGSFQTSVVDAGLAERVKNKQAAHCKVLFCADDETSGREDVSRLLTMVLALNGQALTKSIASIHSINTHSADQLANYVYNLPAASELFVVRDTSHSSYGDSLLIWPLQARAILTKTRALCIQIASLDHAGNGGPDASLFDHVWDVAIQAPPPGREQVNNCVRVTRSNADEPLILRSRPAGSCELWSLKEKELAHDTVR